MRRAGDNEAALGIYQKANVPQKVIEGLAAKGDFEALSKFRCSSIAPPDGTISLDCSRYCLQLQRSHHSLGV